MALGRLRIEKCWKLESNRWEKMDEPAEKKDEVYKLDFRSLLNQVEKFRIWTTYDIEYYL